MTIYMMLTSDLRYLVWLEQKEWKHLKRKSKKEKLLQKPARPFLENFLVEIDWVFEVFDVDNFYKEENDFLSFLGPRIWMANFNEK